MIATPINGYKLRFAGREDISLIHCFIKELAIYENLLHEVKATEEGLTEVIFDRKIAEVIIGEYHGMPVGFGLFYYSLSTFIGRPGIYLEDLFVKPEYRGKGFGKIILSFLAKLALERNCWGLEWACLYWNEHSIEFYRSLGARERSEWKIYRLRGGDLHKLATEFEV